MQKPYHVEKFVQKNKENNNLHPSYPTNLNLSLQKYSDDFYDNLVELVQNTNQLFPKTKEELDEKLSLVNKALTGTAESNLEPRDRI